MLGKTIKYTYGEIGFLVVSVIGLYIISIYNYLFFHSAVEFFAVTIGSCVFLIMWNERQKITNDYLLFLGISFLFVSVLDFFHALSYQGMGVFTSYGAGLSTELWIAARYIQAISLLIAPLFFGHRVHVYYVLLGYGVVSACILLSIFFFQNFPQTFVEGFGVTPFKALSEYLISIMMGVSVYLLYVKKADLDAETYRTLAIAVALLVVSELTFSEYISLFGAANVFGHLIKFVAYYFIYKATISVGIAQPYNIVFRNLALKESELEKNRDSLKQQVDKQTEDLKLFSLAVKQSSDSIILVDTKGIAIFVNAAASDLLGYGHDELIGKRTHDMVHKKPDGSVYPIEDCPIRKSIIEGKVYHVDSEVFWRKDNSWFWVEYKSIPFRDDEGNLLGAVVVFSDITEKRKTESRLKELSELRGRFLQIMSHMLSTPLTAINWNLEEILGGSFGKMSETQQEFLSATHIASKKVTERINALLMSMDIEEGRLLLIKEEISLRSLCAGVIGENESKAKLKNVTITFETIENPPVVVGDGEKMRVVFRVLVDNAITYSKPGGKVIASLAKAGPMLRFEIVDSGIGIPEVEQPRIFSRFFRATNASVMQPDSFGIGLSVAKYVVELHGGKIGFDSVEGGGSRFWFEIPYKR